MKHIPWQATVIAAAIAVVPSLAHAQWQHGGGPHGAGPSVGAGAPVVRTPPTPRTFAAPVRPAFVQPGYATPPVRAPINPGFNRGGGPVGPRYVAPVTPRPPFVPIAPPGPRYVPPAPVHPGYFPSAPVHPGYVPGVRPGFAGPRGPGYYGRGNYRHGYYGQSGRIGSGFDVDGFRHRFYGLPGWQPFYGTTFGLPPALMAMPNLAFLNDGYLVGSYDAGGVMVYVYLIEMDGVPTECRVDAYGNVLSMTPVP